MALRNALRTAMGRTTESSSADQMNDVVGHLMSAWKIISALEAQEKVPGWKRNLKDMKRGLTKERNAAMGLRAEMDRMGG